MFLFVCINKDNLDVNALFSFHLVFCKSDIYASKWLKKSTNVCGKGRRALYNPHSNPVWGSSPPQHFQKLASMLRAHISFCTILTKTQSVLHRNIFFSKEGVGGQMYCFLFFHFVSNIDFYFRFAVGNFGAPQI